MNAADDAGEADMTDGAAAEAMRAFIRQHRRHGRLLVINSRHPPRQRHARTVQVFPLTKVLLIRDEGWEVSWGTQRERLGAGDMLAVMPHTLHGEQVIGEDPVRVLCLMTADDDVILDRATMIRPLSSQQAHAWRFAAAGGQVITQLVRFLDAEPPATATWKAAHRVLLAALKRAVDHPAQAQRGGKILVAACRQLIERDHHDPDCTVSSLAAALDVHRGTLARCWRAATGGTLSDALAARRITTAQGLLLSSTESIATVARRSGYRREDVFIRAFHRATGSSPARWRRFAILEGRLGMPADRLEGDAG